MSGYFDYWGKSHAADQDARFHRLAYHSLDVAAIGTVLLARDPAWIDRLATLSTFKPESLRRVVPYLLALHDLGKFSESFQDYVPELVAELQGARNPRLSRLRHDSLGFVLWRDGWASRRPESDESALLERLHRIDSPSGRLTRRDTVHVLDCWMAAVLAHHGRPPANATLPSGVFEARPLSRSRRDAAEFAIAVMDLLDPGALTTELDDVNELIGHAKRSSWWIAGFTILCDWLGSATRFFPYTTEKLPLAEYWPRALAAAERAVASSGLVGSRPRPFRGMAQLFPDVARTPTPLQREAERIELGTGPQLFVLEDLTGSGKTEAALVLAHRLMSSGRARGLFFALPTMATANAMHGRVQRLLQDLFEGPASYLLTHSGPRLEELDRLSLGLGSIESEPRAGNEETATSAASAWLSDGRKKALLAELGVGTIDQALLAILQSRHAALRLLGLHRNILVVDEVHACDAYMLEVLAALLRALAALGGSAILLSATLPLKQRQKLVRAFAEGLGIPAPAGHGSLEYPLLTAFGKGRFVERAVTARAEVARTLPVQFHRDVDSVVERLAEASRAGQCACWVRNSVKDAVEGYDALTAVLGVERVTLFHARFTLEDRLRIEQHVLERFGRNGGAARAGHVVVATQVVEQSLDVDFDVMVTDLCPIDLVIQRAGRLQRHPDLRLGRPPPVLEVLAPPWMDDPPASWLGSPFHRTARVYDDPSVLWRTARELERRGEIALPHAARELVEAVYGSGDTPPGLEKRADAAEGRSLGSASVAQNAVLKLDVGYQREGVDWSEEARTPTRIGEPTVTLRLARLTDAGTAEPWAPESRRSLRWQLSQLNVARRLVSKACPEDAALREQLEKTQPFVGDDVVTVVLRESGAIWTGRAIAERMVGGVPHDVSVRLVYSSERGLDVQYGD